MAELTFRCANRWLTRRLTCWLHLWLHLCLTRWLNLWLTRRLTCWLHLWLTLWLTCWLTRRLNLWLTRLSVVSGGLGGIVGGWEKESSYAAADGRVSLLGHGPPHWQFSSPCTVHGPLLTCCCMTGPHGPTGHTAPADSPNSRLTDFIHSTCLRHPFVHCSMHRADHLRISTDPCTKR